MYNVCNTHMKKGFLHGIFTHIIQNEMTQNTEQGCFNMLATLSYPH